MSLSPIASFLAQKPWNSYIHPIAPPEVMNYTGMLIYEERLMLSWLIKNMYKGVGEIAELGVFLGASSAAMANGLQQNKVVQNKTGRIHSYDRFFGDFEKSWILRQLKIELNEQGYFGDIYRDLINPWKEHIVVHENDFSNEKWTGEPIEILFVDIMKAPNLTNVVVNKFFPYLIPGKSIVVMQDYIFKTLPYSIVTAEYFSEYFEYAGDTGRNSMLFAYTKQIPDYLMAEFSWFQIPDEYKLNLLLHAASRAPNFAVKECVGFLIADFMSGKYR
jgi:hypothetical protein